MIDVVNMDYDELCELADTLSDMLVLAKRYDFDAVDTAAVLAVVSAVTMDAWNVAFYWVIVAAYWGLRLWEELRDD